jgi:CRP-like cAMP-binding protein
MDDRMSDSTERAVPDVRPDGPARDPQDRQNVQPPAAGTGGASDGRPPGPAPSPEQRTEQDKQEGFAAAHAAEQNRLLAALPLEEYARLLPRLVPVRLMLKQVLVEPDAPIRDVYFPREGVGSMVAVEQEGGPIEVGTVGRDGFVGLPVLLGADAMPYRVFVQIEGHAWRLSADAFRQITDERPAVRRLLLRYAQYFADQLAQSVACNRLHTLDERCARWLLMTHDRVDGDAFELTHEFLSLMLGVRRAGVTVAMGTLQAAGIVRYTRGRVVVLDRPRLEEASCGCYHVTRTALERLLG